MTGIVSDAEREAFERSPDDVVPDRVEQLVRSGNCASVVQWLALGDTARRLEARSEKSNGTVLHLACASGDVRIVKSLIEMKASCDAPNIDGLTPLCIAAKAGHANVCKRLLCSRASTDGAVLDGSPTWPLVLAVRGRQLDTAEMLVNMGADDCGSKENFKALFHEVKTECPAMAGLLSMHHAKKPSETLPTHVSSALIDSPSDGSVGAHRALLTISYYLHQCNGQVNALPGHADKILEAGGPKWASEMTMLLTLAVRVDKTPPPLSPMRLLLQKHADVNMRESASGYSALHLAAQGGWTDAIELLVTLGAQVELPTLDGSTSLKLASRKGKFEACISLLCLGARVDAIDDDGESPLMSAAFHGHLKVVELLLKNGADARLQRGGGRGCFEHGIALGAALSREHTAVAELLHSHMQKPLKQYRQSVPAIRDAQFERLLAVARSGDTTALESELSVLEDPEKLIDHQDVDGSTALMDAAMHGSLGAAQALLKAGADAHLTNKDGLTARELAIATGQFAVARLLLRCTKYDVEGTLRPSLSFDLPATMINAVVNGATHKIKKWLNQDGKVNAVVKSSTAEVNSKFSGMLGCTMLSLAAELCNEKLVKFLIAQNADVDVESTSGKTPLHSAAAHGGLGVVKALLEASALLDLQSNLGNTALGLTVIADSMRDPNCHLGVMSMLLNARACINLTDELGCSPLMLAAQKGHFLAVRTLLRSGANAQLCDFSGNTALTQARNYQRKEVIDLLAHHLKAVYGTEPKDLKADLDASLPVSDQVSKTSNEEDEAKTLPTCDQCIEVGGPEAETLKTQSPLWNFEQLEACLMRNCLGCGAEPTQGIKFSRCERCKVVSYCSRACQKSSWKLHKSTCGHPLPTFATIGAAKESQDYFGILETFRQYGMASAPFAAACASHFGVIPRSMLGTQFIPGLHGVCTTSKECAIDEARHQAYEDICVKAQAAGAIPSILRVMAKHQGYSDVQLNCTAALITMLEQPYEASMPARLDMAPGIPLIVRIMADYSSLQSTLQRNCCIVLFETCTGTDAAGRARKQAAADSGAIEAVTLAMKAYPKDCRLVKYAMPVLQNICFAAGMENLDTTSTRPIPGSAIQNLHGNVRAPGWARDDAVKSGEYRKTQAVTAGALDAILHAMKLHERSLEVQENGMSVLNNLCNGFDDNADFRRSEAVRLGIGNVVAAAVLRHGDTMSKKLSSHPLLALLVPNLDSLIHLLAQSDNPDACIPRGARATIQGLKARPELNGKEATVGKYNTATGRYEVVLDAEDGGALLALKPDALHLEESSDGYSSAEDSF